MADSSGKSEGSGRQIFGPFVALVIIISIWFCLGLTPSTLAGGSKRGIRDVERARPYLVRKGLVPESPLARPSASPSPGALEALARLRDASTGDWDVAWDTSKGTPRSMVGGAAGPYPGSPETGAGAFLEEYAALFHFTGMGQVGPAEVISSRGGTLVGFVQYHRGIPVYDGTLTILLDDEGFVRMASGGFHVVSTKTPDMKFTADEALGVVLRRIDRRAVVARGISQIPSGVPADVTLEYASNDVSPAGLVRFASARPAWFPTADGMRVVWITDVALGEDHEAFRVFVDGVSGELVYGEMLSFDTHETIRVYETNPDKTGLTDEPIRDLDKPATGGPLDGAFNKLFNGQTAVIPNVPYNHSIDPNDPFDDLNFAEQNAFYHSNLIRQYFVDLNGGGNFGGFINLDTNKLDVLVHRVDSGDPNVNNAGYSGFSDTISFGHGSFHTGEIFGQRDTALDETVIYHEYGHRINGPVAGFGGAIYGGAMNEGLADYWAATFSGNRYLGGFSNADPEVGDYSGWLGFYGFIRSVENDRVYSQLCDNPFVDGGCEVHSDGEIYAGALWDLRQALIAAEGPIQGVAVADALILQHVYNMSTGGAMDTDTFIEGLQALLTADLTLFGAAHFCVIYQVFAAREMGFGATSPASPPPVTSTQVHPSCVGTATVAFSNGSYTCADPDSGTIQVTDPNGGTVTTVTVTTDSGDSETLGLTWGAGSASTASFDVEIAAATPGNGVIETSGEGDRILATYVDNSPARTTLGAAVVECTPELKIVSSRLFNGSCDGDDPFLDGGESGRLGVTLENLEPTTTLSGLQLTLVSNNVRVTVDSPQTRTMPSLAPGARAEVFWAVQGDAALGSGETVDYQILISGAGITGAGVPLEFTDTTERDLDMVTQVAAFDFTSGDDGFVAAPNGPSGTETWNLQTDSCASPPNNGYWHQGLNGCGLYSIGDSSWLVSPGIRFQPAFAEHPSRLIELRYKHRVDFDVDVGAAPFIQSDRIDSPDNLQQLPAFYDSTDNSAGFVQENIDLTSLPPGLDVSNGWVIFRWLFIGNSAGGGGPVTRTGWYVDDVEVEYEQPVEVGDATVPAACVPAVALAFDDAVPEDPSPVQGNGDGIVDPGEIITLPVSLGNVGTGTASSIVGHLSSDRPDLITFVDDTAAYADILALESGVSDAPHFTFAVDPTTPCNTVVNFSLDLDYNGNVSVPGGGFSIRIGSLQPAPTPLFADDFETDSGMWTVNPSGTDTAATGAWQRVNPTLNCYSDDCVTNNETQPGDDFDPGTGSGQCFITQNGGAPFNLHDVDDGDTTLRSSSFDLSGATDPSVSYARWVYNRDGDPLDAFVFQVSNNDGTDWTTVESVSDANGIPLAPVTNVWTPRTFLISDHVPVTNQMRFRFIAQDQDPGQIIEAALDAFEIRDAIPTCNGFTPAVPVEVSPPGAAVPLAAARPTPGQLDFVWQNTTGALTYRIISGDLADLQAFGGVVPASASTLVCGIAGLSTSVPEPAGSAFFLVAGDGSSGTGPLGNSSVPAPRTADLVCP